MKQICFKMFHKVPKERKKEQISLDIDVCISVICVKTNRNFRKNKDLPGKFIKKTKIGTKIA